MNAIPLTKIEGDTTVSRNAAMGGNVRVGGSALIKHGLRVEGWADLLNIKGCNKGLFESFEALKAAYPQPRPGWWAMTYTTTGSGETLEATYTMYMVEEGVWVSKGTTTTPQEFDTQLFQYLEDFDNLEKRDDELAAAIDAEEAARKAADRNLAESIAQEVADREDADAALEDRLDAEVTARSEADTALGGRIDTESTARVTADEALANDISKVAGDLAEEAVTRLDQITALRDDLEGEMQNCRDADEALANAIADETHSRQSDVAALDGKIAEEVRRAQAAEALLRDDLTALSTDAQETESSLKGLRRSIGMPGGIAPLDSDGTIASRFIPGAMDDVKAFSGCVNSSIFEENGVRFYESTEDTSAAPNSYVVYDTHLQMFLLKQYAGGGTYDFYRTWGDAELWNDVDAGSPHDDKVYVDRTTNKTYRWAEDYGLVVIGTDLALGETAYTAYPGNLGAQTREELGALTQRTEAIETRLPEVLPFCGLLPAENARIDATLIKASFLPEECIVYRSNGDWILRSFSILHYEDAGTAPSETQAERKAPQPLPIHYPNWEGKEKYTRSEGVLYYDIYGGALYAPYGDEIVMVGSKELALLSEVKGLAQSTEDFNEDFGADFSI